MKTKECSFCNQVLEINPNDMIPAMVELKSVNGESVNLCKHCIIKIGKMTPEERDEFFSNPIFDDMRKK